MGRFYEGERVRHPIKRSWGVGQVMADSAGESVEVFFEFGGRRSINLLDVQLVAVETGAKSHPVLDALMTDLDWNKAHHHVYMVLLDPTVLRNRRFWQANPDYQTGKSCFYVGVTGLSPERRFQNHKRGYKANRFVRRFGLRLVESLVAPFNPMPYEVAVRVEEALASRLRSFGYAVWQH